MASGARIGVYGGTFDPIHNTHLEIARTALRHARLDKVLFVVAASPPHKRGEVRTSPADRYAMVAAALADEPNMEPSRLEIEREGLSYTADTLRQLEAAHPGATLYLIIGSDSLADLPEWREPEAILQRARLLVLQRPGAPPPTAPMLEGRWESVPFVESPLSSTCIRHRLRNGDDVSDLAPPAALRYIHERGLYHAPCQDAPR